MPTMENSKQLHLFKLQSVEGTPETGLVGTDLCECNADSNIEPDVVATELDIVSGGFDQYQAVIGRKKANSTLSFPLRNYGAAGSSTEPHWGKPLQCAGFAKTENNGYYIYTPTNDTSQDGTHWMYSGSTASSGAILRKAGNLKYDWKVSFDFAGTSIAMLELTGAGQYDNSAPADATQPSVTKNRTVVPPLRGVTMTINGVSGYRMINLEINGNQAVEPTTLPTDNTGVGIASITNRKIKFSMKAYMELNAVANPENAMYAITEGLTDVLWDSNSKVQITANYAQITKVTPSDENGVTTWDIEGQFNRNDFSIRTLGGATSSSSSSSSSSS